MDKINFSKEFTFSLCTKCHSKYNCLGKKVDKSQEEEAKIVDTDSISPVNTLEIAGTNTSRHIFPSFSSINISETVDISMLQKEAEAVDADSIPPVNTLEIADLKSESLSFEIKFKLILKFSDGKCTPAKWESIIVEDFYNFKNGLKNLVQLQFEDQDIF